MFWQFSHLFPGLGSASSGGGGGVDGPDSGSDDDDDSRLGDGTDDDTAARLRLKRKLQRNRTSFTPEQIEGAWKRWQQLFWYFDTLFFPVEDRFLFYLYLEGSEKWARNRVTTLSTLSPHSPRENKSGTQIVLSLPLLFSSALSEQLYDPKSWRLKQNEVMTWTWTCEWGWSLIKLTATASPWPFPFTILSLSLLPLGSFRSHFAPPFHPEPWFCVNLHPVSFWMYHSCPSPFHFDSRFRREILWHISPDWHVLFITIILILFCSVLWYNLRVCFQSQMSPPTHTPWSDPESLNIAVN